MASAACVNNVPILSYEATVSGVEIENPTATITFQETATGGRTHTVGTGMPLTGSFTWPGYSPDPEAWPGWTVQDGEWVEIGDNANLGWTRDAYMVVSVNPTASVAVSYPAATAACMPPEDGTVDDEVVAERPRTDSGVTPTDSGVTPTEATLPETGFTSMPLAIGGAALLVAGAGLVVVAARRTSTDAHSHASD